MFRSEVAIPSLRWLMCPQVPVAFSALRVFALSDRNYALAIVVAIGVGVVPIVVNIVSADM